MNDKIKIRYKYEYRWWICTYQSTFSILNLLEISLFPLGTQPILSSIPYYYVPSSFSLVTRGTMQSYPLWPLTLLGTIICLPWIGLPTTWTGWWSHYLTFSFLDQGKFVLYSIDRICSYSYNFYFLSYISLLQFSNSYTLFKHKPNDNPEPNKSNFFK